MTPSFLEGLFLVAALSFVPAFWRASRVWTRLDAGARLLAAFLAADIAISLVYVALQVLDLHPEARRLTAVMMPFEKLLLLLALASWQVDLAARRLVAVLAVLALLFLIPALRDWRQPGSLGIGLASLQALLIFTVTVFLMVRRWLDNRSAPLRQQPWFWLAGGLALFYGTYALIPPLNRYFHVMQQADQVAQVAILRSAVQILTGLLFYRGYRCVPLAGPTGVPVTHAQFSTPS